MGRLTQAFAYVNSTPQDWQNGRISINDFTHLSISDNIKLYRRWIRYGKEETFEGYIEKLKKKLNKQKKNKIGNIFGN